MAGASIAWTEGRHTVAGAARTSRTSPVARRTPPETGALQEVENAIDGERRVGRVRR